jgi:hypothetical protein
MFQKPENDRKALPVVSFPFYHLDVGNALLSKYPVENRKFKEEIPGD